jgi:phosphoribosylamine-glycine ligase
MRRHKNNFAVHSLACRLLESAENGRGFLTFPKNPVFIKARKLAKSNGVIVKYNRKNAEYYAVRTNGGEKPC